MKNNLALITGCSSGIGLHLAHEFASHGHPLVLVAPVKAELDRLAVRLSEQYGTEALVVATDLEHPHSAQEVFEKVQAEGLEVDVLVNNAGHGYRGASWELSIEQDLSMIRLNIEAVLRLTKLFLPGMLERGRGRILNTASVAGFEPGPLLNVYHATKAFVLSWSEALAIELETSPVSVTALCPGPTDTDFFPKAGMLRVRGFQEGNVMSPQEVAKAGYEGMLDARLFVVPGMTNKAMVAARRLLSEGAQAEMNRKLYEELPPQQCKRHRGDIENAALTA